MVDYSVSMKVNRGKDSEQIPQKAYANLQLRGKLTLSQFARHIADHGTIYSRADIYAVLTQMVDCLKELILEGYKVNLGELGDFSPSLRSTGCEALSNFTSDNIKSLSINWSRGPELKNFRDEAQFNLVAKRANQTLLKSAEKSGSTTMELYRPETTDPQTPGSNTPAGEGEGE